jgi:hypothetical protein
MKSLFFSLCSLLISGCTSYSVKTTDFTPVQTSPVEIPDEYLLDIGIEVFKPDLGSVPEQATQFTGIREAESVWVAEQLKSTLQESGAWGVVRVIPDDRVIIDLKVTGSILQSDGEIMRLAVRVADAAGEVWIDHIYEQQISHYAYSPSQAGREPFLGIYNEISNDLYAALNKRTSSEKLQLRKITSIQFARDFSPEAFDGYLVKSKDGTLELDRLPAENDPMLARVDRIRSRDDMFVDVLQDYYRGFTDNMDEPYRVWREQSYQETLLIQRLEDSSKARKLGGWLALIGGVGGQFSDNELTQVLGQVAIFAGLESIRSGYTLQDEALLHVQTLSELGDSLEQELEPSVIELQDRTVTLAGTVRDQYEEWRTILRDIYYEETGYTPPPSS